MKQKKISFTASLDPELSGMINKLAESRDVSNAKVISELVTCCIKLLPKSELTEVFLEVISKGELEKMRNVLN